MPVHVAVHRAMTVTRFDISGNSKCNRLPAVRRCHSILRAVSLILVIAGTAYSKNIDLATKSDFSGTFEIGFCAGESPDVPLKIPGHAFVSFSHKDRQGNRSFLAIGHTKSQGIAPIEAVWSYFGSPVHGFLKEEVYSSRMQVCLMVNVDKSDYEAAFALSKSPLRNMGVAMPADPVFEAYKLGAEDCVSFVTSVAAILRPRGLKIPKRGVTELPLQYIRRMVEAN
jgi:hypothetical protein